MPGMPGMPGMPSVMGLGMPGPGMVGPGVPMPGIGLAGPGMPTGLVPPIPGGPGMPPMPAMSPAGTLAGGSLPVPPSTGPGGLAPLAPAAAEAGGAGCGAEEAAPEQTQADQGGGKGRAKGGGKGFGKGFQSGGQGWPKPAPTVPSGFEVDADARYAGTVEFYSKLKGYGFIEVTEKGVVPDDRLFVQWRNIQSEDRFPFLVKGLEVEFGVMKWRDPSQRNQVSLRAKTVTLPGGGSVHLQDEIDAAKKTFIGGQEIRYTGTLKFYNPRSGYGYITVDPGYMVEGSSVPSELRVERSEVNAGGKQPQWMQNLAVEFGIWTTSRGVPKAYNVTLPGGIPITQAALENRQAVGGQTYRGEVRMWHGQQGWGFIKADASVPLPPHVQAKLAQQTEAAQQKAQSRGKQGSDEELLYVRRTDVAPGVKLQRGSQVMFQLYVDDRGVGATDVHTI